MDKFREKLFDLSSIGIADISAAGVSAFFWFYIASVIGPDSYGEIAFFLSIAGIASAASLLGAYNTLVVYTAKNVKIQSTMYLLTLMTGTISSIVVFLILYSIGTSFLILGYVIFGLVTSELLGRKLYRNYSKFVILQKILMTGLAIGLYYILGNEGILIGMALSFSPFVIGIIKGFKNTKINFGLIKERFNFLINSYLETLSGALHNSLDKIIIVPLFGFTLLGNYSLSLQFYFLLTIIPQVVSKYIVPQDSTGFENKKLKKLVILFSVGAAILGFTIGPLILSSVFPKFIEADEVIRIVSWAVIPTTVGIVYQSKFLGSEKGRNVFFMSISGTVAQIMGIIILGSIYGVNGIAVAFVLGMSVNAIIGIILDKLNNLKIT